MIRQHFYPKAYFRHRSLSKGSYRVDSFIQNQKENCQHRITKQTQFNKIKYFTHKQQHNEKPQIQCKGIHKLQNHPNLTVKQQNRLDKQQSRLGKQQQRINRKQSKVNKQSQKRYSVNFVNDLTITQEYEKNYKQLNSTAVVSNNYYSNKLDNTQKIQNSHQQQFIQEQVYTQISSENNTKKLRQLHNSQSQQLQNDQNQLPIKYFQNSNKNKHKQTLFPNYIFHKDSSSDKFYNLQNNSLNKSKKKNIRSQYQNDIKNLFIKSDRKEIIKQTNRHSYRVLLHSKHSNQSFLVDQSFIKNNQEEINNNFKLKTKTHQSKRKIQSRKLVSADASQRCYRKSIQRKKKHQKTPAQIIINASLSTVDVPKTNPLSQRKNQPLFEKMTQNLINLNLSKAIKYRQSNMQQKLRKQRKNSQKIGFDNIENRTHDLQQKVKGWQILVQDDVDFS